MHTIPLETLTRVLCVLELNCAVETKVAPTTNHKLLVGKVPGLRWAGVRIGRLGTRAGTFAL